MSLYLFFTIRTLYPVRRLNSLLGNTCQNLEVFCVDDGSRDRSRAILQQYSEKAPASL
ncbi:MAG: glycosyltransferase [Oscillospiraceae bacterium]|nr:glycosyltransferase [Oscillospiraceae bacterium]